jgi:hypothetical protein
MASNNNYATKSDLKDLRDELVEAIHDTETKLLKAFYEYAESNRLRLVTVETDAMNLSKRLAIVEDKLLAIEKKLDLPNAS